MINLKIKTNGTVRNLTLPYPGQSIPDIIEKNSVVTVSEVTEPESLKYMEGHEWNIEEINFLAKRMESFDKREKRQFDAIASQLKPSTGQDLINQTFNLSRYTLISDFSSLTEIGKTHIINRKQAMSFDEMASTDFAKIGKDLIESGKGIPTAYGVMFINEDIPMDIVYNGKHFPEYDYKGSLATVAVTCKGETEYLYLPCSIQDINHALTKLPAKTWEECECTLESSNFPAEDWNENSKSILANEGVYCLNNVCEAVRRLHDESDFEKLSAAMQMADVDDSGSIAVIANQLSDFIYIPDAEDNEDVGRYWIENIFGYEYDEALEDYIDFASFGEDVINDHDCSFLDTGGFIALEDGVSLDRMLEAAKAEKKFCENIAPPKPTPDDPNLITERFFFPLKYSVGTYNEYGDMDWEADDLMRFASPETTLREKVLTAKGKKKSSKLTASLNRIKDALESTGKGSQFTVACAASLGLMIIGCVVAVAIDNLLLIPVFAIAFALIPFAFAKRTINYYDNHVSDELETALSIITTSYVRSDDIVTAVKENVQYLKPPVRDIFACFVAENSMISANIKQSIKHLREKVKNSIFKEWCDTLIACQDDRTLKDTLMPVVAKLTDVRLANNEIKGLLFAARTEYFMMAGIGMSFKKLL